MRQKVKLHMVLFHVRTTKKLEELFTHVSSWLWYAKRQNV